jgi:hypothetical protein
MLIEEIKNIGIDPEILSQAIKDYLEIFESYNKEVICDLDPEKFCKNEIAAQQLKMFLLFLSKL